MRKYKREQYLHLIENFVYLIIWVFILGTPVWGEYKYAENGINWRNIAQIWLATSPILIIFIINNYILLPFLLIRKKAKAYLFFTCCLILSLVLLNVSEVINRRQGPKDMNRPPVTLNEKRPEFNPPRPGQNPPAPRPEPRMKDELPHQPGSFPHKPMQNPPFIFIPILPMPIFLSPMVIAIFVIGLNIGIKFLFKSIRDDQRLKELEKHNLQTELEYLKHQINPHFFMNTLNNIHALIDIDSEKAKDTVLELSKMMRYVLYEAANSSVLLSKEIQFLNNYIELMKLRYTDQIEIIVSIPNDIPNVQVPPLLFISFVENAFKHGVSYQHNSFIHISMDIEEGKLRYLVSNSNFENTVKQYQGIGLENVRKRLDLLYEHNYTLDIQHKENEYHVLLLIPLSV